METNRFKKNFLWNMIGSTLSGFNSMFFMIIITRINGTETAGIFTLLFSVTNLLWVIGIYYGRTFQITDKNSYYTDCDYVINRILSCLLMFAAGMLYSLYRGYTGGQLSLVMVLLLMRSLEAGADVLYGVMQKNDELYKCGISLTIKTLIGLTALIILDLFFKNLQLSFIVVDIIWILIILLYDIPNSRKYIQNNGSIRRAFQLFGTGFYAFAYYFLNVYLSNATKYALEGRVSATAQAMYGIVLMPATLINMCAIYLLQPYINEMRKQYKDNQKTAFKKSMRIICAGIAGISAAALIAATLLGVPVLNFVYHIDISDYLGCLQLILVGATLIAIVTVLSTALTTMRNTKIQFAIYLIISAAAFLLNPLMVSKYGVNGAALAYLAISVMQLILYIFAYTAEMKKWNCTE